MTRFNLSFPVLVSALVSLMLVSGCEEKVGVSVGADEYGASPASSFTMAANQQVKDSLDLDNQADFEQARKGLIASVENLKIVSSDGRIAWDQSAYKFLSESAPDTVNPSLWRQEQLNSIHGLFEVVPGIHQLRGFDLANMTLIDSDNGWILVDPLTTAATASYALNFARQQLGDKPIKAVIFTHSHIDHFGGIDGVLTDEERATARIIAPEGFMLESVSEMLMAGVVMGRRADYMYGRKLPVSPRAHVGTGLGKQPAIAGAISILEPTDIVTTTGQTMNVDGVEIVFQNAPQSEAPAELTFYLPKFKAYCGAEMVSRTLHNLYTLRGAKVRNALAWSGYIDEVLDLFGEQTDVYFGSHHWPIWGNSEFRSFIERQRDTYKFIHDQTMRLANQGYTPREIAETIKMPAALEQTFDNRGYYGTLKHNSKAVYQWYFGWYDANPANLDPHPPEAAGKRYVDAIGGIDNVLQKARQAIADGDYRWSAELLSHAVFAEPSNTTVRQLLADSYDQLGYQAESGPWRDVYLSGASELRHGITKNGLSMLIDAKRLIEEVPTKLFFETMATNLNADKAEGKHLVVNMVMTDINETFVLTIANSVMHPRQLAADPSADVTVKMTRDMFLKLVTKTADLKEVVFGDELEIDGSKLALISFFSLFDESDQYFSIVTP